MFCEIWQNRNRLSDVQHIFSYLKVYLRRKLLKEKVNSIFFESEIEAEEHLSEHSYEYQLIQFEVNEEKRKIIEKALAHLTHAQKEILTMKYFNDFNYSQIANLLQITPRTAYNHVFDAISKLRKLLK
jgi:RNA polymerase sigma factor (sigma-70 family)